jgi:hypothetical protein
MKISGHQLLNRSVSLLPELETSSPHWVQFFDGQPGTIEAVTLENNKYLILVRNHHGRTTLIGMEYLLLAPKDPR